MARERLRASSARMSRCLRLTRPSSKSYPAPQDLNGCDAVVIVSWNVDLALRDLAAAQFPRRTILPAYYNGVVLER